MSRRLLSRIRREELLARYGGEEFAAVLPETDHDRRHASSPSRCGASSRPSPSSTRATRFPVTISIGRGHPRGQAGWTPAAFIRGADDNLYRAKRGGRNCVIGSLA